MYDPWKRSWHIKKARETCKTACRSLSQNARPAAGMSTRQIPPQLQWMRVVVVTCTTRGSFVCHLCNCNTNLHCKQVAVTACTTRGLCLSVLQLKANVNGECKCRSLHVRPVASSTCPLTIPKRTCSGCGTIQAMGSLCLTKSMQIACCLLSISQKLQWMWVAITSYLIQALSPICQFFNWKKTSTVNFSVIACMTRGSSALFSTTQVAVTACTHVDVRHVALPLVSSTQERNLQQRMQVSSHEWRVGLPLVFSATQKNTCSASRSLRWLSLHVTPVASVCLFFNWKQTSTAKASDKLAVSVGRLSLWVHEKKIAEMSKGWLFFPWYLRSSSSSFSKCAIILSLLHMAPFPSATAAAPVSQCDRRMLDKISVQGTETEESIWPGSKVCENRYQRRHSHRPWTLTAFHEKSSSFSSSPVRLKRVHDAKRCLSHPAFPYSDKKNAHGHRRAISVRALHSTARQASAFGH